MLRAVPGLKIVLTVVVTWFLLQLLGNLDWGQVLASLERLTWWEAGVLAGVALLRQALVAGTLTLFVPGLGLLRAAVNDVTAGLVSLLAPPPADFVLRLAMLRAWGIPLTTATAGLTLNSLTFYVARFAAPAVGLVLTLAVGEYSGAYAWTALASGLIASALVIALVALTRGERAARVVGRQAGRLASRVAPARADPDRWSSALVRLQATAGERLRRSGPLAALDLAGLLLTEGVLLVLCLRFVGVSSTEVSGVTVVAALFVSYPLTALPFSGLGVLDTAVIATLAASDTVDTATLVAGLVIWRVCLLLLPLLLGGACLAIRRCGFPGPVSADLEDTRSNRG